MENLGSQDRLLRTVPRNVSNSVFINNNGVLVPSDWVHLSNIDYVYYMRVSHPIERYLVYDDTTNTAMWYKKQNDVYVNCLNDGRPWDVAVNVVNKEQLNSFNTIHNVINPTHTVITKITRQKYLKYKNKYINLKKSVF
jgi:hypothetical protein